MLWNPCQKSVKTITKIRLICFHKTGKKATKKLKKLIFEFDSRNVGINFVVFDDFTVKINNYALLAFHDLLLSAFLRSLSHLSCIITNAFIKPKRTHLRIFATLLPA